MSAPKFQIDRRRDGAWARTKVRFLRFRQNTHTKFVLLAREIQLAERDLNNKLLSLR
jgi:hypothetical protein